MGCVQVIGTRTVCNFNLCKARRFGRSKGNHESLRRGVLPGRRMGDSVEIVPRGPDRVKVSLKPLVPFCVDELPTDAAVAADDDDGVKRMRVPPCPKAAKHKATATRTSRKGTNARSRVNSDDDMAARWEFCGGGRGFRTVRRRSGWGAAMRRWSSLLLHCYTHAVRVLVRGWTSFGSLAIKKKPV